MLAIIIICKTETLIILTSLELNEHQGQCLVHGWYLINVTCYDDDDGDASPGARGGCDRDCPKNLLNL